MPDPTTPDAPPKISVQDAIRQEAQKAGVPWQFALAIAEQESGFNPTKKSPKGALGVMQLMPDTAKSYGIDPENPYQNIQGGMRHLRMLMDKYEGDLEKTAAAYNGGEGVVESGKYPAETTAYVPSVMGLTKKYTTQARVQAIQQKEPAKPTLGDPTKASAIKPPETLGSYAKRQVKAAGKTLYESLPYVGGAVGGAAGATLAAPTAAVSGPAGPATGAVVGAGLGGMLGRYGQFLIDRVRGKTVPSSEVVKGVGQAATGQMEAQMAGEIVAAPLGFVRRGGFLKTSKPTMDALRESRSLGTRLSGPEIASDTRVGQIAKMIQSYAAGAFAGGQMQRAVREEGTKNALKAVDDALALLGHSGMKGVPTAISKGLSYEDRAQVGKLLDQVAKDSPPIPVKDLKDWAVSQLQQTLAKHLSTVPDVADPKLAGLIRQVREDPSLIQRMPRPAMTRLADLILTKYKSPTTALLRRIVGMEDQANAEGVWQELQSLRKMGKGVDDLYASTDAQRLATVARGKLRSAIAPIAPKFDQALTMYNDLVRGDYLRDELVLNGKPVPKNEDEAHELLTTMGKRLREATTSGRISRQFGDPTGQQVIHNVTRVADQMEKRSPVMAGNLRKIFELGRLMTVGAGIVTGHVTSGTASAAALWEGFPDFFTWVIHNPKATSWFIEGTKATNPTTATSNIIRLMELYRQSVVEPSQPTGQRKGWRVNEAEAPPPKPSGGSITVAGLEAGQ